MTLHSYRSLLRLTASLVLLAILAVGCSEHIVSTGDELYAELELTTNVLHIGDIVTATLTVNHPSDGSLKVPSLGMEQQIVVRNREWEKTATASGQERTEVVYTLTSLRPGMYTLTEENISFERTEGDTIDIPFPFTNLTVTALVTDESVTPRDIKDLVSWPRPRLRIGWFLVLAALILLIVWLLKGHLLKPRTILNYPPPPPAHEVALRALRALRGKQYIEDHRVEPFYVELSNIVRHYIEDRFDLHASELTTEEFIREATSSQLLSADHQHLTYDFLEQSDLVKFARHKPTKKDMENGLSAGERLVRETIPEPEPQEDNQ